MPLRVAKAARPFQVLKGGHPKLLELLKEFLYIVCTRKFTPIFKKIRTKSNEIADFISRRHDPSTISELARNIAPKNRVEATDNLFNLHQNW